MSTVEQSYTEVFLLIESNQAKPPWIEIKRETEI